MQQGQLLEIPVDSIPIDENVSIIKVEISRADFPFAFVYYARNEKPIELAMRYDLGKRVLIDLPADAEIDEIPHQINEKLSSVINQWLTNNPNWLYEASSVQ